jgi:hypothetical protein
LRQHEAWHPEVKSPIGGKGLTGQDSISLPKLGVDALGRYALNLSLTPSQGRAPCPISPLINTKATSSAPDLKFDFKAMSLKEASLNITWRF